MRTSHDALARLIARESYPLEQGVDRAGYEGGVTLSGALNWE